MITDVKEVILEDKAYSGSMFATTKDGEGVFINARIVALLKLEPMEEVRAFVLPNYPDKQAHIQWRAVRVERIERPEPTTSGLKSLEPTVEQRVLSLLQDGGIFSNAEIAEELGIEPGVAGTTTARLFIMGKLAKAEVHRRPGQLRPSMLLYATDVEQFE